MRKLILALLGFAVLGCFLLAPPSVMSETNKEILFPPPDVKGTVPLETTISRRRSERQFKNDALNVAQIGQLLWAVQGITSRGGKKALRAAPSAGGLYPLEIYVLTIEGIFHYLPEQHSLSQIRTKDSRLELAGATWGQDSVRQAPVSIVICGVYERVTGKYGGRGERYVHMEVGHAAENAHLQAVAMGLGSVPVGAFDDARVAEVLGLPKEQKPLYIIPVGYIP